MSELKKSSRRKSNKKSTGRQNGLLDEVLEDAVAAEIELCVSLMEGWRLQIMTGMLWRAPNSVPTFQSLAPASSSSSNPPRTYMQPTQVPHQCPDGHLHPCP